MNRYIREKPTKCTKQLLRRYELAILTGSKPLTAARTCGISDSTYYAWIREAKENSPENPASGSILEFLEITERARSEFISLTIAKATGSIRSTSDALAVLRAVAPDEFKEQNKDRQDLTVNQLIVNIVGDVAKRQNAALNAAAADSLPAEFVDLDAHNDDDV